jgi:hypothetical protein
MSHFTVLVVGDDFEKQLAPFHEFECTGENDEFVQDVDVTEELRAAMTREENPETLEEALGYYGLEDKVVDDESKVEKVGDECAHKYGYAIVKDGVLVKAVDRTNPNRKWDWYQVGGRWSGMLKIKPGATGTLGDRSLLDRGPDLRAGRADSLRKGAIDFEAMRKEAADEAVAKYDAFHAVLKGRPIPQFEEFRRDYPNDIEGARKAYWDDPTVKDLQEGKVMPFRGDAKALYGMTREEKIAQARASAGVTFAVLKDGTWYERGDMGWWGMVADEKDTNTWNTEFAKLIDGLPDDTLLTVVDCHI